MSRAKIARRTAAASQSRSPESAIKIRELRKALGLSQEKFAKELGATRIAAARWERGDFEPTADKYVKFALLASEKKLSSLALWFWQTLGVDLSSMRMLLPEIDRAAKESELAMRRLLADGDVVRVPLLRDLDYSRTPRLAPANEIEMMVPLPSWIIPNPASTCCVRPPTATYPEELYLLDSSQTETATLWTKLVIARHVSRDRRNSESHAGYLHPFELEGRVIPVLTYTKTMEETAALDGFDIHIPVAQLGEVGMPQLPGIVKAASKDAKEAVVTGLAAAFLRGEVVPMVPENEWTILGRVVGQVASYEGKPQMVPTGQSRAVTRREKHKR
jgi:transcriptional regulator with XRE-family HTH domain